MDPIDPANEREWEVHKAFEKKDKEIAALRAEVERLREDLEICKEERNVLCDAVMTKSNNLSALRSRIAELEDENKRLRAELTERMNDKSPF